MAFGDVVDSWADPAELDSGSTEAATSMGGPFFAFNDHKAPRVLHYDIITRTVARICTFPPFSTYRMLNATGRGFLIVNYSAAGGHLLNPDTMTVLLSFTPSAAVKYSIIRDDLLYFGNAAGTFDVMRPTAGYVNKVRSFTLSDTTSPLEPFDVLSPYLYMVDNGNIGQWDVRSLRLIRSVAAPTTPSASDGIYLVDGFIYYFAGTPNTIYQLSLV